MEHSRLAKREGVAGLLRRPPNFRPEEIRPSKDQPYYHLLAENAETEYIAYVSEQNLMLDDSGIPLRHPQIWDLFIESENGYQPTFVQAERRTAVAVKSCSASGAQAEGRSWSSCAP